MYNDGISDHNIRTYIQNKLPKLNEDEFSYYDTNIDVTYNYETDMYNIHFTTGVIKKCESTIKIPRYNLHEESMSNLYKYLNVICTDINEQITGTHINNDYFELNGVKYYPEKESE